MRSPILSIILISCLAACTGTRARAQHPPHGPLHYLTVMGNRRIADLRLTSDSLVILFASNRPADPEARRYLILAGEEDGKFYRLYAKQTNYISLFVYYLSPDKKELYLLHETPEYATLAECKQATDTIKPADKYFVEWYSSAAFKAYTGYPTISTLDSAATSRLAKAFVDTVNALAGKRRGTHMADLYGSVTIDDILTRVMIANHLNPVITIPEFSAKIMQYHIRLAGLPYTHAAPRQPRFSADTTRLRAPRVNSNH